MWGESLDVQEKARNKFLASGRVEDKPKRTRSSLKLITGISWVMHQLVKEMANVAVDRAWECNLAALWEVWEGDVHLLNPPNVTSNIPPLTLPQRNYRVGEEQQQAVPVKRGRKSEQQISGNQRSVRCFFPSTTKPKQTVSQPTLGKTDDPWLEWTNALSDAELNKMLRERKIHLLKKYFQADNPLKLSRSESYVIGPDIKSGSQTVDQDQGSVSGDGLSRVCAIPSKIEIILLNSTVERGAEVQCQKNTFSSPTSNKLVKKRQSVAELSTLFNSSEGGSRGVEKHTKGVICKKNESIHNNSESCHSPKQSWFQKLQVFRVPDPEKLTDDQLTTEMWETQTK